MGGLHSSRPRGRFLLCFVLRPLEGGRHAGAGETINWASHYGGSPLILLNKDLRMVARKREGDLGGGA